MTLKEMLGFIAEKDCLGCKYCRDRATNNLYEDYCDLHDEDCCDIRPAGKDCNDFKPSIPVPFLPQIQKMMESFNDEE